MWLLCMVLELISPFSDITKRICIHRETWNEPLTVSLLDRDQQFYLYAP